MSWFSRAFEAIKAVPARARDALFSLFRPAPAEQPAQQQRRERQQQQRREGLVRGAHSQQQQRQERQQQQQRPPEPAPPADVVTLTNRRVLSQNGPLRRVQFEADGQVLHEGNIKEMAKAVMRAVAAERLVKPAARLVFESSVSDSHVSDITFSEAKGQMTEVKVAELLRNALDNKIATNSEGDWLLVRFELFGRVAN